MAVSRVIEVSFGRSSVALVRIDTAYFYNNGILFKPTDIDLPASYQVHWADSPQASTTLETIGTAEGAPIPDDLWDRSRVIYGWIYLHPTEDSGITAYEVRIYKNVRAGLPDGTEPTPEEQSVIDQAISALNTAVAKTAQDVISADQSARSASGDADRAEQARTAAETAQGKAEDAQESAERAKDDAETSERNASESERNAKGYSETASEKADSIHSMTASAQTLPAGSNASASYNAETGVMSFGIPKGKDGTDGEDGYSPTANVSKTGKVATITITDKNGTTSAQVEDGEDGTDGIDGISPSVSVTDITGGHRVVITDKDGTKSFDVEDGATGATPNLTIGTVETLEPTDDATATITGTAENPVLNFGIPKGEAGEVTLEDYYKAFPIDTASGSIASFSDGADDLPLKSLVVDINPIQDLSHGDPSPENICPISGWTEVQTNQSGANILNPVARTNSYYALAVGTTLPPLTRDYSDFANDTITIQGSTWVGNGFISEKVAVGRTYRITGTIISSTPRCTFVTTDANFKFVRIIKNIINSGELNLSVTIAEGESYIAFSLADATDGNIALVNPCISESGIYEPYTGRSITISLGQTVYGGTLDVVSGVLTVDMAIWALDSDSVADGGYGMPFSAALPPNAKLTTSVNVLSGTICNQLKEVAQSTIWGINGTFSRVTGIYKFYFKINDDVTTIESLNEYLALHPMQFCYELATPLTVQLTPHEVRSLLGSNNIWADTGDTEVTYRADPTLYISRLTEPDADMVADANITSGQYFMVGNTLYKATANIASGATISPNVNCTRKSLSEALNELNA